MSARVDSRGKTPREKTLDGCKVCFNSCSSLKSPRKNKAEKSSPSGKYSQKVVIIRYYTKTRLVFEARMRGDRESVIQPQHQTLVDGCLDLWTGLDEVLHSLNGKCFVFWNVFIFEKVACFIFFFLPSHILVFYKLHTKIEAQGWFSKLECAVVGIASNQNRPPVIGSSDWASRDICTLQYSIHNSRVWGAFRHRGSRSHEATGVFENRLKGSTTAVKVPSEAALRDIGTYDNVGVQAKQKEHLFPRMYRTPHAVKCASQGVVSDPALSPASRRAHVPHPAAP